MSHSRGLKQNSGEKQKFDPQLIQKYKDIIAQRNNERYGIIGGNPNTWTPQVHKQTENQIQEKPKEKDKSGIKQTLKNYAKFRAIDLGVKHAPTVGRIIKDAGQSGYDWAMTRLFGSVLGAWGY